MKHYLPNSLRALFLSLAVLLSLPMLAVEVEIDGINYDLDDEAKRATVIRGGLNYNYGEVVIPESVEHEGTAYSVTSIGSSAFESCSGLTSVTIGNGVTSIGDRAFYYCYKLLDVYCYAEKVPSTESDAFDADGIAKATLHVPANAVKSYGASWTSFGTITSTVEVSSVGYATLFLDYDAEIPKGIEAYIAKEVVGENLKMEKVENQEGLLPAETGVIIKAEAGKYDFNLYPNANSVSVDGNLFVGSAIETMITAEDNTSYYILSASDDNVGMYPVDLVDGAFVCKANKAYLPISSAHARIYFDFGTETGILETENGNVKTENCYDLSGRRVHNAQKGIFIVNGKKVVK